jgi:hypothetical protein
MPKAFARKILIILIGVLLVLMGILFQLKQNSPTQITNTDQNKDMASVLTASLQQQRRYFQRCWLRGSTLSPPKDPDIPAGQLTWQIFLKIEPTGRVKDFALINKGLFDAETEKCLKEISYRLKFPSFDGDDIAITVPIVISNISENH